MTESFRVRPGTAADSRRVFDVFLPSARDLAALTPVSHMSLVGVYAALTAFTALFTWRGIHRFTTRVIT